MSNFWGILIQMAEHELTKIIPGLPICVGKFIGILIIFLPLTLKDFLLKSAISGGLLAWFTYLAWPKCPLLSYQKCLHQETSWPTH